MANATTVRSPISLSDQGNQMIKSLSTLKRKIILALLMVVSVVLCLLILVACDAPAQDLYKKELAENGWTIDVKFDYQGGIADGYSSLNVFVKPGSKIPNPSNEGNNLKLPQRVGYSFRYYCVAEKNDDGTFKLDENGNYIPGDIYDFNTLIPDTVESDEIVLLAQWWKNYSLILHYGDDFKLQKTPVEISRLVNGDPDNSKILRSTFTTTGYTILDYYLSEDTSQEPLDYDIVYNNRSPLTRSMFDATEDGYTLHMYAETLEGNYVVLRTASDITKISAGSDVFVYKDIDMSTYTRSVSLPSTFNGSIYGNNKTISNLTIEKELETTETSNNNFGIFNTIGSTAVISNLTIENASYKVVFTNPRLSQMNIGLFAGAVMSGAKLENVHISGNLEYELVPGFTNIGGVFVDEFIGNNEAVSSTVDSGAENVAITEVEISYAANASGDDSDYYAVYIKYILTDNKKVVVDVYGIATKGANGYSRVNITSHEKVSDGNYLLNVRIGNVQTAYYVVVVDNNGIFTVTVNQN